MTVLTKNSVRNIKVYALPMFCIIFALVLGAGCKDRTMYNEEQPPAQEEQPF